MTEHFFRQQNPHLSVRISGDNMIMIQLGGDGSSDNIAQLKRWAEDVKEAMRRVYNQTKGTVLTLIDISQIDQYDSESMQLVRDLMDWNKQYATRTATFGGGFFEVMAQDALALMTKRDNIKAFRTKEQALGWLKTK